MNAVAIALARKALPWLLLAAALAALFATRAKLARVKLEHEIQLATIARKAAEQDAADQARVAKAADDYAARAAALQPIIVRSRNTVRTYAETPAGRAPCLAADRVRGIDDLDAAIAAAAQPGAAAVRADAGVPPDRR